MLPNAVADVEGRSVADNILYYGDNLPIMRQEMGKDSIDLIYLDPPFNSKRNYNLMYKTMTGMPVPEQVEAFCDTWELDAEKEQRAREMPLLMREYGMDHNYADFWRIWVNALRNTQPHLLAYLIYMVERLLHMKILLRPTGSIYLHCDPTASHYIKIMMDGIFGHKNFRSEIIWKRTSAHSSANRYGPVHDVLLFYSKADRYTWNRVYQAYDPTYVDTFFDQVDDQGHRWKRTDLTGSGIRHGETGHPWRGIDVTAKGRHSMYPPSVLDELDAQGKIHWPKATGGMPRLKQYPEDLHGVPLQDVWTDIRPMHNLSRERLGYPTQKPITLLKRILEASSDVGNTIFDPFCGCGTTIYAAHETDRKWIGCDIAILPIKLIQHTLAERYRLVEGRHFIIDGIPASVEQASMLFQHNPFQFQHWFVERVGGFPMQKKVADKGIDGRLYFETREGMFEMVLSVKGGTTHPSDIRDLRGVLEREPAAQMAGFLTLKAPTKAMREEAASAGCYAYEGSQYDRIQILTVRDVLEGKKQLHTPTRIHVKGATGQLNLAL
jgi:DNA modification methylase